MSYWGGTRVWLRGDMAKGTFGAEWEIRRKGTDLTALTISNLVHATHVR